MATKLISAAETLVKGSTEDPDTIVVAETYNVPVPSSLLRPISTKPRFLMGTGPTNYSPRVSEALCKPLMGLYMDETHQVYITVVFRLE